LGLLLTVPIGILFIAIGMNGVMTRYVVEFETLTQFQLLRPKSTVVKRRARWWSG
jgi:hypothetical protein